MSKKKNSIKIICKKNEQCAKCNELANKCASCENYPNCSGKLKEQFIRLIKENREKIDNEIKIDFSHVKDISDK